RMELSTMRNESGIIKTRKLNHCSYHRTFLQNVHPLQLVKSLYIMAQLNQNNKPSFAKTDKKLYNISYVSFRL
ncbi:MAG: hypothetical protein Q4A96_04715, partial [Candidatus Saccharibacteria bacterium]|nr:hypothetical protein [Candidatus Saccharibacteria bacterium]